ncbi:MAG: hypothetical protein KDA45_03320 [Planctomycetales bacterium]|nr:hypothetical protein [Planctomycetales bacterium]
MAQPLEVWAAAYDHALGRLKWPAGCTPEISFLWSVLMQEQAEVLVRAGLSAKKVSAILAEEVASTEQQKAEQLATVVGLMDQSLQTLAFEWLDTADAYPRSALGLAALAWHLPEQARRPGNEWLTQWLQSIVERMTTYTADLDESVICHLVLQCEMPLLMGLATSASQRTVLAEASKAMDSLAEHLERSEDQPAPWLAHGATYLRSCLASVVRCRVLANSLGLRKWYPPQQRALAGLLKHAARWARADGTQLLAAGHTAPRSQAMWEALVKQTRNPKSMAGAMALSGLRRDSPAKPRKKVHPVNLPPLTYYSEEAAGVCMQSDWRKKGARLALDFSDQNICLEALGPKGSSLLAGEWTLNVELEGQAQLQLAEWGEVCWFSDDDVDYLELEAKFGKHARVQRQAVLLREERLLLLADALLCDRAGEWSLRASLPLAADARFEPAKKTTEGFILTPDGGRCLVLPLFLPEWRRQVLTGGLDVEGEALLAQQRCQGQRLYAATLLSLCNSHAKKPFTWRRLTVGEDLRVVSSDEAAAFRVQLGNEQWVFYRSLAAAKRRTAVGIHTLSDFLAARLHAVDGSTDTFLEVVATVCRLQRIPPLGGFLSIGSAWLSKWPKPAWPLHVILRKFALLA